MTNAPEKPSVPAERPEDRIIEENVDVGNTTDVAGEPMAVPESEEPRKRPENKVIEDVVDLSWLPQVSDDPAAIEKTRGAFDQNPSRTRQRLTKNRLNDIAKRAEDRLKERYPDRDVEVKVTSHKRDLAEQAEHFMSGASKTPLSLHNFGMAGDYAIYIDGKRVTADGSGGLHGSVDPYRVLGGVAKDEDLFWGWKWDSGHVGETRWVTEALEQNPDIAQQKKVRELWNTMRQKKSIPRSLKGLMDTLSTIYNEDYNVEFKGEPAKKEELLTPLR